MFTFTKEIAAHGVRDGVAYGAAYGRGRPCAKVCGVGAAEVVLLRQVLGLCLRLSVRLSSDCPACKGS